MTYSCPASYRPLTSQIQCPFPLNTLGLLAVQRFLPANVQREIMYLQKAICCGDWVSPPHLGRINVPFFGGVQQPWITIQGESIMPPSAWLVAERHCRAQELGAAALIASTLIRAFQNAELPLRKTAGALWVEHVDDLTYTHQGERTNAPLMLRYMLGEIIYVQRVVRQPSRARHYAEHIIRQEVGNILDAEAAHADQVMEGSEQDQPLKPFGSHLDTSELTPL